MKRSNTVVWLSALIAVLALIAAGIGLFWQEGSGAFSFTTLRGESVQMYGRGVYHYDTVLIATGYRVGDAGKLILAIPLLVLSCLLYRRGSLRGGLWLSGMLAYFSYDYGSLAFGAAYNNLFLVYVAILSASLFGLLLALTSFDLPALPAHFGASLPRRGAGIFLSVAGAILLLIWLLLSIVPALAQGKAPPELASYSTIITFAVDMGIIAPALVVSGVLLVRRAPVGYLLATTLLVFSTVLGIQLAAMGVVQFTAGLFGVGQFIGMVVSFAILALVALGYTLVVFRHLSDAETPSPSSAWRAARA